MSASTCLAVLLVGCVVSACGARQVAEETASPELEGVSYAVRLDEVLERAWVRACFSGVPPAKLVAPREAADLLVDVYGADGESLPFEESIDLRRAGLGECVSWEVDLERATWGREALRRGGDVLLVPGILLWRPDGPPVRSTVRFELPTGMYASAPWTGPGPDHELPPDALTSPGNLAFVRRAPRRFVEGSVAVELARLDGEMAVTDAALERWIRAAVRAVETFGDGFPLDRVHVVIVPAGPGWRAVAFGLVRRGGGASVMLLPHGTADEESLTRDWTAVHELSHLAMPRMYEEDRWITEGLATYFQEVLRARAGLIAPEEAWGAILRGLERGQAVGTGRTLWREARDMGRTGAYRRVYWSGALWALEADVALRAQGRSLDGLMSGRRDALAARSVWRGRDCLEVCDRALPEPLLLPLAERYGDLRTFPDATPLLARLGVAQRDGRVVFDERAPLARVREAIMAAR